jgi:5-methylcytosine-specific restriction protein A
MILKWYDEIDHQATSIAIMLKNPSELKSTPYNGIVNGFTDRILKNLNRFEVIGTEGNKSRSIVPFEGWYEDYNPSKRFVWKLRDELVQAEEELDMVDEQSFQLKRKSSKVTLWNTHLKARRSYITLLDMNEVRQ